MKTDQLRHYRQALIRIVDQCRTHPRPGLEEPLAHADWEEQAANLHDRYIMEVDREIRWEVYGAARRALHRLGQGEYGRCTDCGQEISTKRLDAVPWTERCVACQAACEGYQPPGAPPAVMDAERYAA